MCEFGKKLISEKLAAGKIIGLDHSDVMVSQASNRNRSEIDKGHVELLNGGIKQLENYSKHFNKIFSINVLQFDKNRIETLLLMKMVGSR